MPNEERKIVYPSQIIGDTKDFKAGRGTFVLDNKIYSERLGIFTQNNDYINVTPLKGRYDPIVGDFVIGIVEEALSSGWLVNINAPSPAFLHVNEVPWEIEFGDTEKYLNHGDSIMAKVQQVDEQKKLQITLKDRNLYKIKGGHILEVEPSKVPRIIGKKGSMIALIKKYIRVRIFVGQNGRIWVDGDTNSIDEVVQIINKIQNEATSFGLTNRIESLLKNKSKEVQ